MPAPSLLNICTISFVTVILVLVLLAWAIALMTRLFPVGTERAEAPAPDAATVAAIGATVAARLGGARVVQIEKE